MYSLLFCFALDRWSAEQRQLVLWKRMCDRCCTPFQPLGHKLCVLLLTKGNNPSYSISNLGINDVSCVND